jgi:hypothetical protein
MKQENPAVDSSQNRENLQPLPQSKDADSLPSCEQTNLPFALIRPKHCPPRTEKLQVVEKVRDKEHLLESLQSLYLTCTPPPTTTLDIETTGTKAFLIEEKVVMVGLANAHGSIAFDFRDTPELYNVLIFLLYGWHVPLVAHNVAFDAAFLTRDLNLALNGGKYPQWYHEWKFHNWACCTYAAYRQFASEGFIGQVWGLKALMKQVLLWPEANAREKSRWLVEHGFTTKKVSKALLEKLTGKGGQDGTEVCK